MGYLFKRIIIIIISIIVLFIVYVFVSTGFFRAIKNHFDGEILKTIALPGAEDITVSLSDDFALISSTDRGHFPPAKEEHGGLYYMDLNGENFKVKKLTDDFKASFAPHGVSIFKKDSTYNVIAVNHTPDGHSLEIFTLKNKILSFEKSLNDPSMVSPNDVVFIDENRFYFTNDHKYTKGIGRYLEDYLGLAISNVIYFDGEKYQEVAKGIAYANGINYDADRSLIYVASPRKFLVKVYKRNPDGSLVFIEDIPCATGVDNIEFDSEGNLWIGAHPNLLRFAAYAKGKEKTSPSEIIKISYQGKGDYTIEQIYMDDGSTMSASTVAAPFQNLILTGNVMDDKFLVLKIKN
ncbi:MAG: SMP-30/gluconolactonase/LRE family protein [Flavobacteriaceae bacterium]|nr:SMP-30/gluconolactonase/LRE family protein [Flavobacteriaceae bacterium]